jgi:hypothetical protein
MQELLLLNIPMILLGITLFLVMKTEIFKTISLKLWLQQLSRSWV